MKDRLDVFEIIEEIMYSFVYDINGVINDILSVDNGASRNMTTQYQKKGKGSIRNVKKRERFKRRINITSSSLEEYFKNKMLQVLEIWSLCLLVPSKEKEEKATCINS